MEEQKINPEEAVVKLKEFESLTTEQKVIVLAQRQHELQSLPPDLQTLETLEAAKKNMRLIGAMIKGMGRNRFRKLVPQKSKASARIKKAIK